MYQVQPVLLHVGPLEFILCASSQPHYIKFVPAMRSLFPFSYASNSKPSPNKLVYCSTTTPSLLERSQKARLILLPALRMTRGLAALAIIYMLLPGRASSGRCPKLEPYSSLTFDRDLCHEVLSGSHCRGWSVSCSSLTRLSNP